MAEFWQQVQALAAAYGGRAVAVVVLLLVGWVASRYLVAPLRRLLERGGADPSVASFLTNTVRTLLLVVIVLAVLQQLGVATTSLLALLGAAALAVSLSLQSSLGNFAAGLLLLSFRTVRVGDLIEVGGQRGYVTEMLPFHIVLVSLDNQRITIPNATLVNGPVLNQSALRTRRAEWTLTLTPADDLAAVKAALRTRLLADPRILPDPPPQLFVREWAPGQRLLTVQAWTVTANYLAVQQEMLEPLGLRLEEVRAS
jgi:small conductance mechanosensitive channel